MAKKKLTCAAKKDFFTPCYCTDGTKALDASNGKCLGCGRTVKEIENPPTIKPSEKEAEEVVQLSDEQATEMKKIHKELYKFFKAMENAMLNGLVNGKTGWDIDLPIVLRDRATDSFNKLLEGSNIEKESVDLANFCMMIWRRVK
jgi:predicted Fe-S protein YdhL (DUF1289 family)